MKYRHKLRLSYVGTHYSGWQIQKNVKTVQGELEAALSQICKGLELKVLGSSRTDAGVHALAQMVRIDIPLNIPKQALLKGLNSLLPRDIRVEEVLDCEDEYHPIFSKSFKEYHYHFSLVDSYSPFQKHFVAQCPFPIDIPKLQKACELFVGEWDFQNYFCVGSEVPSTVRKVTKCQLVELDRGEYLKALWTPIYRLEIQANGFLKQMVRLIVGTLWEHARGKVSREQIRCSLQSDAKGHLGAVAPAAGLLLYSID